MFESSTTRTSAGSIPALEITLELAFRQYALLPGALRPIALQVAILTAEPQKTVGAHGVLDNGTEGLALFASGSHGESRKIGRQGYRLLDGTDGRLAWHDPPRVRYDPILPLERPRVIRQTSCLGQSSFRGESQVPGAARESSAAITAADD